MSIRRNRGPVALVLLFALGGCGYTQSRQDADLLFGLHHLAWQLWEQYLAGTPAGDTDRTFSQDGGGTFRVVGTTTAAGPHTLTWTFDRFAAEDHEGADLVLDEMTGTVAESGQWEGGTLSLSSDDLVVRGRLARDGFDPVALDGPLPFRGVFTSAGGWGSVDGRPDVEYGDPSGSGGGGGECSAYSIECGRVVNGAEVVGGLVPEACPCPPGTQFDYVDTQTAGGPYNFCVCL